MYRHRQNTALRKDVLLFLIKRVARTIYLAVILVFMFLNRSATPHKANSDAVSDCIVHSEQHSLNWQLQAELQP